MITLLLTAGVTVVGLALAATLRTILLYFN
jgi:hypothetical protein